MPIKKGQAIALDKTAIISDMMNDQAKPVLLCQFSINHRVLKISGIRSTKNDE